MIEGVLPANGSKDPVIIEYRKGSYAPVLRYRLT
jgi:hypothetical protein